jgi:hypothetical protein
VDIPGSLSERARQLGSIVARVQAIAASVARRSRTVGVVALAAAPVAWLTLFHRWAFDGVVQFLFFAAVLVLLAAPGFVMLTFSKALEVGITHFDDVLAETKGMVTEGGKELVTGLSGAVAQPGLRQLGTLLGSLWKLRDFRADFGSVLGKVAMTTRLVNPLFLAWVAASALGAGLVILLALLGLVLLAA